MNKVEFVFLELNGKNETIDFLNSLTSDDRKKLISIINKIREYGIPIASRMKWTKKLDRNIFEIRSQFGSNIQRCLYFHDVNNTYIITHGFTKKTDKTPKREIRHANELMERYMEERR